MRIFRVGLQPFVTSAGFISGKTLRSKGLLRSMTAVAVALMLCLAVASAQTVYRPSTYSDGFQSPTQNPQYAFDGDPTTAADVYGFTTNYDVYLGDIHFYGFPSAVISATATLTVTASFDIGATGITHVGQIRYSFDGGSTFYNLFVASTSLSQADYTISVPSGTDLSNVQIWVHANPGLRYGNYVDVSIYDINIQ